MIPLTPEDLVLDKSNGNTKALGMNINSYLCKNNECAAHIIKTNDNSSDAIMKGGGPAVANISDMFRGLAVPAGLLYLQQSTGKKYPSASVNEDLEPGLFERLLDFASDNPKLKDTPIKKSSKNNTKRKKAGEKKTVNRKTKKNTRRRR